MDISESRMEKAILEFIERAYADDIAYIAGYMFGGDCTPYFKEHSDKNFYLTYDFQPNKKYAGKFDSIGE